MNDLKQRLDELRSVIQERDFLEGKGILNEVNIRIFCYDPQEELTVRHFVERLLRDETLQCRPVEFNLYRVLLSICESRNLLDKLPALEEDEGSRSLREMLQRVASNKRFVEKMRETPLETGDVVFITGVGEAFPFIRVHALLEEMQLYFSELPVVVMYPGVYDGRSLKLFDKLAPNPYYRAFNLL
ncbi:MAG: DUF1788 domain-containing protein [Thermoguttaceae bacterium]|jgi:hypothetical protein